ncbi:MULTISPECIES: hypothetical protein [Thermomonas]|jgi:hypothetical protein|uniref:hypothetical protein n=1 Tax=Thermomonas TaxID=141948 RepID=UPI0012EB90F7|nr:MULTISPECIES: hypothetical protein [Thermomonas]
MPSTHIAIHEYGNTTRSYVIPAGVVASGSIWEDCLNAISASGFRPAQWPGQTIRRPNAWSNPANNVGNAAASQAFVESVKKNPHVHGGVGVNHRAAIGCRLTPQVVPAGSTYQFMKIYIGQFS